MTVDQLILTSRSSATGPGFINLLASVDGAAPVVVASIIQNDTNYNDEFLSITPVTAHSSVVFSFETANQLAAEGGGAAIGPNGTFRIGDYNPSGTPTPFTIDGTITPAAVPEPSTLVLGAVALAGLGLSARFRRRLS